MKFQGICFGFFIFSQIASAGVVEERVSSALDGLTGSQFSYNPAFLGAKQKKYSVLALKDTRSSSVTGSPNNSNQQISYEYKNDILGFAGLFPFGGGAAGLSYIQVNNSLDTDNSASGSVVEESKRDDIYAFRFIIELTPSIDFGFHYEYKQAANHIFGNFFLGEDDKSNYKAFLSGYRLGFAYRQGNVGLGLYTAPALRAKPL